MKKLIENQYQIVIDILYEENNYYYFIYEDNYFYFKPCSLNDEQLKELMIIIDENDYLKSKSHIFINNISGSYITEGYILFKVQGLKDYECDINDLITFNTMSIVRDQKQRNKSNWPDLWSLKMDYFEYQIREIGKDKKLILSSFSYFLGLAETAISYLNKINTLVELSDDDRYCLTHTRVIHPNEGINFYDPLSYIIDFEVRDIVEYIKSEFYQGEDIFIELDKYFKNHKVGEYSIHLIYARMIYPSTYFDIYEKVIHNELDEDSLIIFIKKSNDYLEMLKKLKLYLSNYVTLININYL